MLARVRDWRQTESFKHGYERGKQARPFGCPWWADRITYSLAYMEGRGVKLTSPDSEQDSSASPAFST